MEGKGFEPTFDALFGTNGFFPDTVLKTMFFVADKMPVSISATLERIIPALRGSRTRVMQSVQKVSNRDAFHKETFAESAYVILRCFPPTQPTQNFMRDMTRNLNKLVHELKTVESPEATVYLRLLGNELGYLKTKDMEIGSSATMMFHSMAKMFPTDVSEPSAVSGGKKKRKGFFFNEKTRGCACSCLWP